MMMNGIHHKRTWLFCKDNYALALSILASSINDTAMLLIHPVAQFAVADHFHIYNVSLGRYMSAISVVPFSGWIQPPSPRR